MINSVAAVSAVARAEWQTTIFAPDPTRLALMALKASWPMSPLRMAIHRNSGVEIFTGPLATFLAYGGFDAEFAIGGYDDSVSFGGSETGGDVSAAEILWLDLARYAMPPDELISWLAGRIAARRVVHTKPILVGLIPAPRADSAAAGAAAESALGDATSTLGGVVVCAVSGVIAHLGPRFRGDRTGAATASPLSNRASIEIARLLGLEWLPAALAPRIKAIAVDLDGTLYAGVLGEDGPLGVVLTAEHSAVQARLHELAASGVFLAVASKNAVSDVDELFDLRPDFPLRLSDFADRQIGWAAKSAGIEAAAARLHISADSFLLVDDNLGEIAAAAEAIPGLRTLLASDPAETARALSRYPGLVGFPETAADAVRAVDLAAAAERGKVSAASPDSGSYLRSLETRLTHRMRPADQLGRLHELTVKTNQFNTALARFSEAEIARRLQDPDYRVITVALTDRLSQSGVIAAIHVRRSDDALLVEEIAISCRALGRGLEDAIISPALTRSAREFGLESVRFVVVPGPRNEPAITWVDGLSNEFLADGSLPLSILEARLTRMGDAVVVIWDGDAG